jgi:hypothetical protein
MRALVPLRPAGPAGSLGQRGPPGLFVHLLEPDLAQVLEGGVGQHRGLLGHVAGLNPENAAKARRHASCDCPGSGVVAT